MKSRSKSKATIERDKQAKVRLAARNSRTDEQQLALLESRGADDCKEAVKIRSRLNPTHESKQELPKPRNRPVRKRRAVPASLM